MNTIKIKHGSGNPDGKLQPYELGFRDDTGALYINNGTNAIQLTGLAATGLVNSNNYLKLPAVTATTSNTGKILVSDSSGIVYYKTAANILSEIKALPLAGGTLTGATTFSNTLTANGAIVVGSNNYGTTNPNDAGKTGVVGQLYFVLTS